MGQAAGCAIANDTASYNLADFMFGLPSQVQLANWLVGNYRQRLYFLYLQDDFRVNSKFTLNLGLRWEYATPRWERDNVLSNYDPISNSMIQAKPGSICRSRAGQSGPQGLCAAARLRVHGRPRKRFSAAATASATFS